MMRVAAIGVALILSLVAIPFAQAADAPPNIVLILADDLGQHQLGCYGSDFYQTPHLDRLATQGMRFTNAYAAASVCSPTRASIMTGKYPARLHITDFIPGDPYPNALLQTPDWQKSLPLEEVTVAELLADAGYISGHFGKWHLNMDKDYAPGRPGDPGSQGFADVLTTHKPKSREAASAKADPDFDAHHITEITDRAIAFMETNRNQPFFCYVTHNSIHTPNMAYGPLVDRFAAKPDAGADAGNDPVLGAMVNDLDRSVGRIVTALDRLNLADNTILIFFSDNGSLGGTDARKPLYGDKADLYEGGIRVPLIVRWPGVADADTRTDALMSSIDFFPTFAQAAGLLVSDPTVDGISLVPALKGGDMPDRALYWHYPNYHSGGRGPSAAIRSGDMKLIEWFEKSATDPAGFTGYELFDLKNDPGESNNLTLTHPQTAANLVHQLRAWQNSINAQMMSRNPNYDSENPGRRR